MCIKTDRKTQQTLDSDCFWGEELGTVGRTFTFTVYILYHLKHVLFWLLQTK